jgi:hypothetical protein
MAGEVVLDDTTRPSGSAALNCPVCRKVLGIVFGDILVVRHFHRIVRTRLDDATSVNCPDRTCYGVWQFHAG